MSVKDYIRQEGQVVHIVVLITSSTTTSTSMFSRDYRFIVILVKAVFHSILITSDTLRAFLVNYRLTSYTIDYR